MKSLNSSVIHLLILSFISFYSIAETHPNTETRAEVIKISIGEWPPYFSEKSPKGGLGPDLIREAFLLKNIEVEFDFFSWKRAYDQAKAGRRDATALWRKTEERAQHFYFSDVVLETEIVFYHKKSVPFSWVKIEDLKGLSVGVTNSYNPNDEFTKASKNGLFQTQVAETDIINIRKLINNRIDIFPIDKLVGTSLLNSDFTSQQKQLLTYHPKPLTTNQQRVLFSKNSPHPQEILVIFNEGLKQLKESGRYQRLLNDFETGRINAAKK